MIKPKVTHKAVMNRSQKVDRCQTPFYALDPLIPHLDKNWLIWESAAGEGNIIRKLSSEGFEVIGSDILEGYNFFEYQPLKWDCQVTNPPYSIKYPWIQKSYELGKPFALLLPVETVAAWSAQKWFIEFGIEIIMLNRRVNFCMPNKRYNGGGAQFPVAWFTWGLGIGSPLIFEKVVVQPDAQLSLLEV